MDEQSQTITGPFGHFIRRANGLVYFYKRDDLAIDMSTAEKFLDTVRVLDDSGDARVMVIQGQGVEYSFEAQHLLLTNDVVGKVAYVIQTGTQYLTVELLQNMAKSFKSRMQLAIFQEVEEAEKWLLNS
ncbi:MAG: hypothetical protein H6657_10915 [Ardenticatenaceae bacterium]|nr:hypothetical protein [Anaerolineales bacterium]MCB8977924.1 hypothetical protein [Ardenticatenaceae bacterium]